MSADELAPESDPPVELDVDGVGYLYALGQTVLAAPPGRHRDATIDLIVRTAARYRADGVSWARIAHALGVDPELLRQWRRIPDAKPVRSVPSGPGRQTLEDPSTVASATATSESITQSQSSTINQHSNHLQFARVPQAGQADSGVELIRLRHARCVLVVSGDARPGGNDFSLEVAEIRQRLSLAQIDVREVGAAELAEIGSLLDHHQPAVLHICAHSAFGGVYLPLMGESSAVSHAALWDTINAARRPPRLVVLNLCSWPATTYGLDVNGVESLICWPDEVDDEQGRLFSRQLHSGLAMRRTIRQAFDDARRTVCDKWPALESPDLHGRDDYLIF